MRRAKRERQQRLTPSGDARGYHGGCPAARRPFLGTYALCLDTAGHVCCYDCGAHDLVAQETDPE